MGTRRERRREVSGARLHGGGVDHVLPSALEPCTNIAIGSAMLSEFDYKCALDARSRPQANCQLCWLPGLSAAGSFRIRNQQDLKASASSRSIGPMLQAIGRRVSTAIRNGTRRAACVLRSVTRPVPLVAGLLGDLARSRTELVAENALLSEDLSRRPSGPLRFAWRVAEDFALRGADLDAAPRTSIGEADLDDGAPKEFAAAVRARERR